MFSDTAFAVQKRSIAIAVSKGARHQSRLTVGSPADSPVILMALPTQLLTSSIGLTPLSGLANHYDGLLCDIWGVIHNGVAAFESAVDALCRYRASGGHVVLITNAPRSCREIYPQLERLGVPRAAFDSIVTSGDVTRKAVKEKAGAPLFHFGPARDHSVLEGLTNPIVGISDAKLCLLTGPLDDAIETVDVYHSLLIEMRDNAVEMICANPDLVVRDGNRMVICAGSIAQRYAQLGGTVMFAGKPEAPIYDEAVKRIASIAGREIAKSRLLAVGDGLPTDIKGAANNNFDAYFISGGIHADEFGDLKTAANVTEAIHRIKSQNLGINLVGICDRMRWT
ncbi:TIGR01459 family HAD-type hydrolase [Roseovarius sp. Pro17]|uniref:TIGR01459 family HAD-type hydrolase n=1 Tax=Roseovarius sp. Pro17 TaxID=3108175 RepID=UPI002D76B4B6|nr:TIGR01459 family HAD-type hydrolase [Roseovarius sp. Pro17]